MSVNEVWLDGLANPTDPNTDQLVPGPDATGKLVSTTSLMAGTAVETLPGLFLTAGHVIVGPLAKARLDGNGVDEFPATLINGSFRINGKVTYNPVDVTDRNVTGGNAVNSINLLGYNAKYKISNRQGSDLAFVQSAPIGPTTQMVVFLNPTVDSIQKKFGALNFSGYTLPNGYLKDKTPEIYPDQSTPDPRQIASVNADIYVGGKLWGGGSGTFQITGEAPEGVSGGGIWGIYNKTKKTYVLGTIQAEVSNDQGAAQTLGNLITKENLEQITKSYTPPAGKSLKDLDKTLIVGSQDGGTYFAGVEAPVAYTGSGGNNKVLAGKYGDTINFGQGIDNELFLPSDHAGTTVVVSPGSLTVVGGGFNDRLVIPEDRLWTSANGDPSQATTSGISDTIQIMGGLYVSRATNDTADVAIANDQSVSTYSVPVDASFDTISSVTAQQGSTDRASWEIGDYDLLDSFHYDGKDLQIQVVAGSPTIPHPTPSSSLWRTTIIIKDYKAGDFGFTFKPYTASAPDWSDYEGTMLRNYTNMYQDNLSMMAAASKQQDVDDDPSQAWDYTSMQPINPPNDAVLASDRQILEHLYDNTGSIDQKQNPINNSNQDYYSSEFGDLVKAFNSQLGTLYSLASGLGSSDPTAVELESLKAMIDGGSSLSDIAGQLITAAGLSSVSNSDFVETLYQKMFGRVADAGGSSYYTGTLQNGTSRSELAVEFAVSSERSSILADKFQEGIYFPDEHASEVARLYYAVFERAPDLPGLQYYTQQLNSSGNLSAIAESFLSSAEGNKFYENLNDKDFINTAFLNAFGRPADSGASDYYASQLAQGETRGSLVSLLINSSEGVNYRAPQIEQGMVHI